ncbi:MAG: hypothetical protein FWB96_00885 [Defluviitaleaceae bacterium]|nr:hypothetical protein [Defluviitaleaceae bacterium]MCL2262763.1 hypothetical protein [Defluviitaleaceae bacterium]
MRKVFEYLKGKIMEKKLDFADGLFIGMMIIVIYTHDIGFVSFVFLTLMLIAVVYAISVFTNIIVSALVFVFRRKSAEEKSKDE